MFAQKAGWRILNQTGFLHEGQLKNFLQLWRPRGVIMGTIGERYAPYLPDKTVLLDCIPRSDLNDFALVTTESTEAMEMAMREIMQIQPNCCAFIPTPGDGTFSDIRRLQFRLLAKEAGLDIREFNATKTSATMGKIDRELAEWLKALPRPIGMITANDVVGMHAISACRAAGIAIPFECSVVSMSDDETLCERTIPSLTGIGLNFRGAGYKAGEILHEMLAGKCRRARQVVSVPPVGIFRRGSSKPFLRHDNLALRATEEIRAKACSGLRARDALKIFPCSRRNAESRFRSATGRTVLEEIRLARLEKAKRLLCNPNRSLSVIASMCGYESDTTFRRFFRSQTGMTMRQWRETVSRGRGMRGAERQ